MKARYPADCELYTWHKEKHGNIFPVLIINGRNITLDYLAKTIFRSRILLNATIPESGSKPIAALPKDDVALAETKLQEGEILVYIPDFDAAKQKIVTETAGEVICKAGEMAWLKLKLPRHV